MPGLLANRHEWESLFLVLGWEQENQKSIPGVRDGNGKYKKKHYQSLGRERENLNIIPVKQDGSGKFESVLKVYIFSLKI